MTLFRQDSAAVYGMRLLGALICAALIAIAADSLRGIGRFAVIGLLVALTPMTLFLTGSATPSGVEVAAAIAVWATLALLMTSEEATEGALDRFGLASVVLILARPIGLLWFVLIIAICALWSDKPSRLFKYRRTRAWAAGIGVASVAALCWVIYAKTLSTDTNTNLGTHITLLHAATETLAHTSMFMHQMLGAFDGDTATYTPGITVGIWIACIALLVLLLRRVGAREALALAALVGGVVAIPVVLQSLSAEGAWNWWRGRYMLPLAVGLPIIIGTTLARSGRNASRVAAVGIPAGLVVGHVAAFWIMLRRYTAGENANWWFFDQIRWHPPGFPTPLLIVLYTVAIAALHVVVVRSTAPRRSQAPVPAFGARPPRSQREKARRA